MFKMLQCCTSFPCLHNTCGHHVLPLHSFSHTSRVVSRANPEGSLSANSSYLSRHGGCLGLFHAHRTPNILKLDQSNAHQGTCNAQNCLSEKGALIRSCGDDARCRGGREMRSSWNAHRASRLGPGLQTRFPQSAASRPRQRECRHSLPLFRS